ncbi:nitrogenase component 1, partial [Klebsiella pneumoniae]|uniref:nitrogenase component 1 n=1 Tax=Klebsiella pneumoniae TaxID=573 RepID=UPI0025A17AAC
LKNAGVETVRTLARCRTQADYQAMGTAWVNIITAVNDIELAQYLEEKLGIPWVCLGGIYSAEELAAAYEKLGELLGRAADLSSQAAALN